MKFLALPLLLSLFASGYSLAAQPVDKPSIKVLWDVSKGFNDKHLPLGFDQADGFAKVLEAYSRSFRSFFPQDREHFPTSLLMVAAKERDYDSFVSHGTFPDIVLTSSESRFTPEAYINMSLRGLLNEDLASYSAIVITIETAAYIKYTAEEVAAVRQYVANGGRLILNADNFWGPRANIIPMFEIFGVEPTMQVTSTLREFAPDASELFAGVRSVHARSGAGLCIGDAPGWHLTPTQVANIDRFGNGHYEYYLAKFRNEYAPLTAEQHCERRDPPAGVSVEYVAFDRIPHEFTGVEETIPVVAKAKLGRGTAFIFADVSWYDNSMRAYAAQNGFDNERLISNVAKFLARQD